MHGCNCSSVLIFVLASGVFLLGLDSTVPYRMFNKLAQNLIGFFNHAIAVEHRARNAESQHGEIENPRGFLSCFHVLAQQRGNGYF